MVGESPGEPSGGRSHALEPYNRPNPTSPDDALMVGRDDTHSADSPQLLSGQRKAGQKPVPSLPKFCPFILH